MSGRMKGYRAIGILLLATLGLAGCGNTPDRGQGWKALQAAYDTNRARSGAAGSSSGSVMAQDQQQLAVRAMKSVQGPVMVALVAETQKTAVLGVLQDNGSYRTWRTASRQTLTFKQGVLTGTRGLGFDLMSSDADASIALIRGRRSGTVQRVYRHIDGLNREVPTRMTCTVASDGADTVALATGATFAATRMKERCRADGLKVTNTYWVTGSGSIPQSIQWVSPEVGKLVLQSLRN